MQIVQKRNQFADLPFVNLSDTPVHNAVRRSSCKGFIQIKIFFFFDEYLIESVISVPLAL